MSDWQSFSLNQIGTIITGRTPPTSDAENYNGNVPFVTPSDMDGRRVIDSVGRYLSERGAASVAAAIVPAGTVIVSCIGSDMGKAAITGSRSVTNQQINALITDEKTEGLFVYYNLSGRREEIRSLASGSAQPILNKSAFGKIEIRVPPLYHQRAISNVLSALDDKIELNRKTNETIEAFAGALFKDWFVDFGPTRAKMTRRPPYLAPELWAQFPERLNNEGKPSGWKAHKLSELAVLHTASVNPQEAPESEFEHFSLPAYDAGQSPVIDLGRSIRSNKTIVPPGAILLSKLNPEIPRVWLPAMAGARLQVCSTEFMAMTPTEPYRRSLLYGIFNEVGFRSKLQSMVTGTSKSHQRVSPPGLMDLEVIVGHANMFALYADLVDLPLQRLIKNREENRALADVRDFLLPGMMAGRVLIREVGRAVEGVA